MPLSPEEEYYQNTPEGIYSRLSMVTVNEEIPIYEGEYIIEQDGNRTIVSGKIFFSWLPEKRIIFKGNTNQYLSIDQLKEVKIIVDELIFGKGYINNRIYKYNSKDSLFSGYCLTATIGDISTPVNEIIFCIPNLKDIQGAVIKYTINNEIYGEGGRFIIKTPKYTITIDKVYDFEGKRTELTERGGYIILYNGSIKKNKGHIKFEDFNNISSELSNFLYFLNGRRTSPLFAKGMYDGQVQWTDYSSYSVDLYKFVNSWARYIRHSELSDLYNKFSAYWKKDDDKDFFHTLIHWYVEANSRTANIEGSIILAQTALELIYNWLIIESKKLIIGSDAENLSASNKIRILLSQLHIDSSIPDSFEELKQFSTQSKFEINDSPEIFTRIRNSLIHGQEKKRKELVKMPKIVMYQSLELSIWYIELALLKILDYNNLYFNRVSNDLEMVPWSTITKNEFLIMQNEIHLNNEK